MRLQKSRAGVEAGDETRFKLLFCRYRFCLLRSVYVHPNISHFPSRMFACEDTLDFNRAVALVTCRTKKKFGTAHSRSSRSCSVRTTPEESSDMLLLLHLTIPRCAFCAPCHYRLFGGRHLRELGEGCMRAYLAGRTPR